MRSIEDIANFRVVDVPCRHWSNKKTNETRNKVYGRAYEVVLEFKDGSSARDIATFRAKGAGRDCFELSDSTLCFKIYPELQYNTNELEYDVLRKYYALCPEHIPFAVKQHRAAVSGHNGYPVDPDIFLLEFTGETLRARCRDLDDRSEAEIAVTVQEWMCQIVTMTQKAHQVGIVWHEDFHSENITWNSRTSQWCLIDLDIDNTKPQPANFEQCWTVAARRLKKDKPHLGRAGSIMEALLVHLHNQWHPITGDGLRQKLGLVRV